MARRPSPTRLRNIYQTVQSNPGERPARIAERLKLNRSEVTRALPALEDHGLRLTEDERGRLWPYSKEENG